jgi:hypothetical protein
LQWFHERDSRIFAATTAAGAQLIVGLRLQRDAEPLDSGRVTDFIELHSCKADA